MRLSHGVRGHVVDELRLQVLLHLVVEIHGRVEVLLGVCHHFALAVSMVLLVVERSVRVVEEGLAAVI